MDRRRVRDRETHREPERRTFAGTAADADLATQQTRSIALERDIRDARNRSRMDQTRLGQLERDIARLEDEQAKIEEALCSGGLSIDELTEKSKRLPLLKDELDEKSMRWLELSEIEN